MNLKDASRRDIRFGLMGGYGKRDYGLRHWHMVKATGHGYFPMPNGTGPIFDSTGRVFFE
jgi:hypothetical protein